MYLHIYTYICIQEQLVKKEAMIYRGDGKGIWECFERGKKREKA